MGKRIERAIREITEDAKEIGKAWKGWTTIAVGIILFLLATGWLITG
jgi:hypothetical protein